ncbi:MAG: hypothetical protein WCG26_00460 [Chloroflexales bacterium]
MPRTLTLTLAERDYAVPVAAIKQTRAWRAQLKAPLDDLLALVSTNLTVELAALSDLIGLADKFLPVLMDAPETLFNLLVAYAPLLEAEREFLEANAYDDEVVTAFLAVLKVVFPLEVLTGLLGPASPATLKRLPTPLGDGTPPTWTTSN